MQKWQAPKGTFDILPRLSPPSWQNSESWQWIESICRKTALAYGFCEIRTPIYEATELFDRGVGETSDIVTKEMFTFLDKKARSMTLRPEGTSSVIRAFLEHRLDQQGLPQKLFYIGPMFRYERPQSGRYRQHHQFGVEAIGNPHPEQDVEVIDLLFHLYRSLGLTQIQVHLNSVGDLPSRHAFKEALQRYLEPFFSELSVDSQTRLMKNPLRILDSKDPKDKEVLQRAPSILSHLSQEAKDHFRQVCSLLDRIKIPYVVDDKIVRGLDYYQQTVFECIAKDLAAQNTIGAGGRYDGLVKTFGGPDLPGVGFATGLERLLQVIERQGKLPSHFVSSLLYVIALGEEARPAAFSLATGCRHANIATEIDPGAKKMQQALQRAANSGAKYCAIIGDEELAKKTIQLKNLETRSQEEISFDELIPFMQQRKR